MNLDLREESKKLLLVFGAIMTASGLQAFVPADLGPAALVVGGVAMTYLAVNKW